MTESSAPRPATPAPHLAAPGTPGTPAEAPPRPTPGTTPGTTPGAAPGTPRGATPRAADALGTLAAALGAALALAALAGIWVLRSAAGRTLYVSELGGDGEATAVGFAWALAAVAAAGLLLGGSRVLAPLAPVTRASLLVGGCLVLAGVGFAVATAYPCTSGCPVPGSMEHTVRDTVHLTAAIAGFALVSIAMLTEAIAGRRRRDRAIAWGALVGVAVVAGIGGLLALARVALAFGAWCEFFAMSIAILWCAATALPRLSRAVSSARRSRARPSRL